MEDYRIAESKTLYQTFGHFVFPCPVDEAGFCREKNENMLEASLFIIYFYSLIKEAKAC